MRGIYARGVAALAMAFGLGCRDLTFEPPETALQQNKPPQVRFVSPTDRQVVSINHFVQLDVEDPNGVGTVTLVCQGVPVFSWSAPPNSANVDLSPCKNSGQLNDAGTLRTVQLTVIATDLLGLSGTSAPISVDIDVSLATLAIAAPARVQPHGPVTIQIESNQPLQYAPKVLLGQTEATVSSTDGGLQGFLAQGTAPGIGADTWAGQADGGNDVPLDLLLEVEKAIPVSIDARATSGNLTHVELQVLDSRILWQKPIPGGYGQVADPNLNNHPVAFAQGLIVPVAGVNGWSPGLFRASDGTFVPYDDPSSADYKFIATLANGKVLAQVPEPPDGGVPTTDFLFVDVATGAKSPPVANAFQGGQIVPLVDRACERRIVGNFDCYSPPSREDLACLSDDGGTTLETTFDNDGGVGYNGYLERASGNTYFAMPFQNCSDFQLDALFGKPGAFTSVPATNPGEQFNQTTRKIVPLGADQFLVSRSWFDGTLSADRYLHEWVTPTGHQPYFSDAGVDALSLSGGIPPQVALMGRDDGQLITLRQIPGYTLLETWPLGAAAPTASTRLPGLYEPRLAAPGSMPTSRQQGPGGINATGISLQGIASPSTSSQGVITDQPTNVVRSPDNRAAMLLTRYGTAQGSLLVTVEANLRPHYVYVTNSGYVELIGDDSNTGPLYLIDSSTQTITALMR